MESRPLTDVSTSCLLPKGYPETCAFGGYPITFRDKYLYDSDDDLTLAAFHRKHTKRPPAAKRPPMTISRRPNKRSKIHDVSQSTVSDAKRPKIPIPTFFSNKNISSKLQNQEKMTQQVQKPTNYVPNSVAQAPFAPFDITCFNKGLESGMKAARTPFAIEINIFSQTKDGIFLYFFNVY